jgi:hypothetical protein
VFFHCFLAADLTTQWRFPTGFDGVVMVGEGVEEVLWWWVFSC